MRRNIILIILAIACGLGGTVQAQTVVKTERFTQMNGTKYYLHTIKGGESIEAIAKAYNTTVQVISMNNQERMGKFPEGIVIRIPVLAENATPASTQEYAYHLVEKKQTLYSICKKYGVSEEDIYKYNPNAKYGIKSGETLKIPVGHVENPDRQTPEFIYHTIKQNESINSICTLYRVDVNDLIKYNPKARTEFRPGMILTLPKTESYINRGNANDNSDVETIDQSDLIRINASKNSDYCDCEKYRHSKSKTIRLAVLLPLFVAQNEIKINGYRSDPNKNQLYQKNSPQILEFYEGVLMAAREYQLRGYNVQLDIYDTENSYSKTNEICADPELKKADLIIGPLYTENVVRAAKFAKDNQIAMVSPFAIKNEILKENPYLFQFTPSNYTSIEETAEYFSRLENANLILVYNNDSEATPAELSLIKSYREVVKKIPGLTMKEINYDNGGSTILKTAMNSAQTNVILMTSNREIFISKVINYLNGLLKNEKYKIELFGSQSWEKISNIDIEFLQNMNFSYRSANFIDYNNEEVKNFVSEFRDRFNAEPGIYGYSGYDITNYFIDQISRKGKYFHFCPEEAKKGLVYKFDFKKVAPLGGYENHSNFVLQYGEDYYLKSAE
ncbi:MAG: LysM peptidoglycan-binding domain-containing protein [Bacteroidales bacterium]|nr:LysM peptidoglycan-binding domain-containing protein [Bacteroidales bacterium]